MPVNYNVNPSYGYPYELMYPEGSEEGQPNQTWTEAAYTDADGVTTSFYSNQAAQQSPAWSPENIAASNYGHYPSHTQNGRLFLSYNKTEVDPKAIDAEQAGRDTPSDSGAHTPDSWSSGSTGEGATLTILNLSSWRDQHYKTNSGSPNVTQLVSNSHSVVGAEPASVNLGMDVLPQVSASTSSKQPPVQPRKTRTTFSEQQMNALVHRFNVQRYLSPVEMKTVAALTGLTYKQVKTWFQNRRMKLKRHQRDGSWKTERRILNGMSNTPAPRPPFQSDASLPNRDHYSNPQMREAIFKSPPNTPFYPSYPQPCSPSQATMRPPGNWPLPPAVMHYEFPNPTSYMQAHVNASINNDCGNAVYEESHSTPMPDASSTTHWST